MLACARQDRRPFIIPPQIRNCRSAAVGVIVDGDGQQPQRPLGFQPPCPRVSNWPCGSVQAGPIHDGVHDLCKDDLEGLKWLERLDRNKEGSDQREL